MESVYGINLRSCHRRSSVLPFDVDETRERRVPGDRPGRTEQLMKIDPREFENFAQIISAVVVPRPIALISSVSSAGLVNLAPFSFFNVVSAAPPAVVVGVSRRPDGGTKDTFANIESTGEFVVNLVNEDVAQAMNSTAADYASDVNEFEVAGLTPAQSSLVVPPTVSESPVSMECRLEKVVSIGHAQQPNQPRNRRDSLAAR